MHTSMERLSMEDFDIVPRAGSSAIYGQWQEHTAGKVVDSDVQIHAYLREHYPDMTITAIQTSNVSLVTFARAGFATAELDTKTDSVLRWRGFIPASHRGGQGQLGDAMFFAKYNYTWLQEHFILYTIGVGYNQIQYLLKEPGSGEDVLSNCAKADALITTAIETLGGDATKFVYVFDNYWYRSRELWDEVMKSSWDKVILDPHMKKALQEVSSSFFDSKDLYDRYGVPWKRGLIFAGPPGNGKTISIKALMKTLYQREASIPTLYVKHAPTAFHLGLVFRQARVMTPCLLVFEDIETIVTPTTRSYFFNEVDGLSNNGGMLMVASTNYLDKLDPGLSKRPSRFDRKFIFPLPNEYERVLYCKFWRAKLQRSNSKLAFPEELCAAMAKITDKFSFAYLQEAFVATLLLIAREETHAAIFGDAEQERDDGDDADKEDPFAKYKLWRVFKVQVAELRENMGSDEQPERAAGFHPPLQYAETTAPLPSTNTLPFRPRDAFPSDLRRDVATFASMPDAKVDFPMAGAFSVDSDMEPGALEMASHGIAKQKYFAESAFEWK